MRREVAFFICLIAVLLPWRLRVWFANAIGWMAQGVYWIYMKIFKIIIRNLTPSKPPERQEKP